MAAFEELVLTSQTASSMIDGIIVAKIDDLTTIQINRDLPLRIIYQNNLNVSITILQNTKAQLLHEIQQQVEQINLHIALMANTNVEQLIVHDSTSLQLNETYTLQRDAVLHCSFGELTAGNVQHVANYHLVGEGSDLQATYVYTNRQESAKNNHITVYHEKPHTSANVENYGIAAGKSKLHIDVVAKIAKGAIQSATHQTSRILTFEEGVNAKVIPSLHIDENDVQASHACSMGVIDEDHLYYLQSRGLTRMQAVKLIVSGYLSPLSEVFAADELREPIRNMIEQKAGEYLGEEFHPQ